MPRISSTQQFTESVSGTVRWPHLFTGLFFTTLATLLLELSLTRIFSVVFFYHFAFLAISIALFGLGAGGVFSYLVAGSGGPLFGKLGTLALVNSFVIILAFWGVLSRASELKGFTLALVYFVTALPFLLAGTIVSLAISEGIDRIDRAYFFDLAGAAAGCLALIKFLDWFGGPSTIIAAAVFFAISAAVWYNLAGNVTLRATAVVTSLLLVTMIVVNQHTPILDIRSAKGQRLANELFVRWNSFSRVAVSPEDPTPGGRLRIVIDADAATSIASFDWNHITTEQRSDLLREGPGFPYLVRPAAKTLVIGAGGGYDVARALASGSKDITAVEINPIIANTVMRDRFERQSQGLYFLPEVHVFVEDGRSFVRGSAEKYQVLQATLVDTWASTAAGAFALSENNLYTTDAFYDYLTHLTDDGLLAFTRWGFDPPRESLRLLSLAQTALARLGENETWRHVMVVRQDANNLKGWGALDTVLISRKPFTGEDVERARTNVQANHLQAVYLPGDRPQNAFGEFLRNPDTRNFLEQYRYDVSPVGDDRPFFFYTVQPRDLWDFLRNANKASADYKVNEAVPLLFGLLAVSLGATLVILLLPRAILGSRLPKQKHVFAFLWYFLCLGAGYILIQVALVQKFVLLLGHPTYALTVIVFSMLVASGLGSYYSVRVISGCDSRLMRVLVAVALVITALAFAAAPLAATAATWPLLAKMAITAAAIAPAAFLMGMPFPTGLRRLEEMHPPSVRWAWSLNAAASVLGSVGAIFLAIYIGLRATLLIGGALYLCAMGVILLTRRTRERFSEPV